MSGPLTEVHKEAITAVIATIELPAPVELRERLINVVKFIIRDISHFHQLLVCDDSNCVNGTLRLDLYIKTPDDTNFFCYNWCVETTGVYWEEVKGQFPS